MKVLHVARADGHGAAQQQEAEAPEDQGVHPARALVVLHQALLEDAVLPEGLEALGDAVETILGLGLEQEAELLPAEVGEEAACHQDHEGDEYRTHGDSIQF
ncbi:hypothetical protein D3C87_1913970 [compost metagenome]